MVMAIALTFLALKVKLILFRIAPALVWMALLTLLIMSPETVGLEAITVPYVTILAFVFVVMSVGVFSLTFITQTIHTKGGIQWNEYGKGPPKDPVESRSAKVKRERREKLRGIRTRHGR